MADGTHDLTEEMAAWAVGLRFDEIPPSVVERAKLQILSVLGAMFAGSTTEEGARVIEVVKRWGGAPEATLVPDGTKMKAANSAYAMAALGMVLDYDDYLFPCHTGHSAVVVSMALSESLGLAGRDWLAAQVMANEVEGRLAGSVLLGPFNGQMCSFIHLLGAAAIGARMKGLGAAATADAIRIALFQTNHGLYGGFMGTGAKALTASSAIWAGLAAAEMAEAGMRGAGDILAGRQGFVREFSFVPLPYMLSGYGKTWLTDTLCYKIYPGCAYIDAAVDCAVRLAREDRVPPEEITQVVVRASLLTIKMDALAAPFVRGPDTLAQTLNFTTAYNVAAALLDGDLTPSRFLPGAIRDPRVWDLASKVKLVHDPARTLALRKSSEAFVDPKWIVSGRKGDLLDFLGYHVAPGDLRALLGSLASPAALLPVVRDVRRRLGARGRDRVGGRDAGLGAIDLSGYRMEFGASVEVRTRAGKKLVASQDVPIGAAGHPFDDTRERVKQKFLRGAAPRLGDEIALRALETILGLDRASPAEVRDLVQGLGRPVAARNQGVRRAKRARSGP